MQEEEISKEEYEEEEERRKRENKKELKVTVEQEKVDTIIPKKECVEIPSIKLEKVSEIGLEKLEVNKETPKSKVHIPIINLQEPSLTLKEYALDYNIPRIEKEEKRVHIPIINLQESYLTFKEYVLDYNIPRIEKEEKKVNIPIIKLQELSLILSLTLKEYTLDYNIPRIEKRNLVTPTPLLESSDPTISKQKHLEQKEAKIESLKKEVEPEPTIPSSGHEREEIPDFLEYIFGGGGGRIRAKGSKIILFKDFEDDSYVNFLKALCARIYREKEGGEPEAVEILRIDEMSKREIEKWLKPSHKIFTINLDYKENEKSPWLEIDEDRLWERLLETKLAGIGFIIFTTTKEETFRHYEKMLERINRKAQLGLDIITLTAKKLPRQLACLAWGVDLPDVKTEMMMVDNIPILTTFDNAFNTSQKEFQRILEGIMNEERGLFKRATNRSNSQIEGKKPESDLHYMIKVFLVRMKVHELRERYILKTPDEIMRYIKTEEGLSSPIPDVQVGSEVYEVETLFGEGEFADKKIDETIRKYDQTNIQKVNIVMDNLGFLMHLKNLIEIQSHLKERKPEVGFYTLDLQNKKLISLEEVKKKVRELETKIKD